MNTQPWREVPVSLWDDSDFERLSLRAQLLYLRLLTSPDRAAGLAELNGWSMARVEEAFAELAAAGFVGQLQATVDVERACKGGER